eukprot:g13696.t1
MQPSSADRAEAERLFEEMGLGAAPKSQAADGGKEDKSCCEQDMQEQDMENDIITQFVGFDLGSDSAQNAEQDLANGEAKAPQAAQVAGAASCTPDLARKGRRDVEDVDVQHATPSTCSSASSSRSSPGARLPEEAQNSPPTHNPQTEAEQTRNRHSKTQQVAPASNDSRQLPTVVINVGMAGSGKSKLIERMYLELLAKKKRVYVINLDPAVKEVKYPRHIDIRDTVNYKKVMEEYGHGPNGAIMTCLGLFAMKFDQVLKILDKRAKDYDYVLIDTPGQIEVFGWSASGQIIADTLSTPICTSQSNDSNQSNDDPSTLPFHQSGYPTVINYVVDTARCTRPVTFMSNMLYACSILYKFQLPFVLSFNKCDVLNCGFVRDVWLKDQQAFSEALRKDETSYLQSLSRSMSQVLEEFYTNLSSCAVSAHTGKGVWADLLNDCIPRARKEYYEVYLGYLEERAKWVQQKRDDEAAAKMKAFEEKMTKTKA